jgi:hypothetical protein
MKRPLVLHPLLWALAPALFLYAHNSGELAFSALGVPLLVCLTFALALWGLITLGIRNGVHSGLMTTYVLILVFSYGHVYNVTEHLERTVPGWHFVFLGLWAVALVAGLVVLSRPRAGYATLNAWANATALLLFTSLAFAIAGTELARWRMDSMMIRARRVATRSHAVNSTTLPNIYYIIFDSYARDDTLKRIYGFDNTPLLHALEQRGFYVTRQSHSNYCQTILSMSSSFNMSYLDDLAKTPGPLSNDRYPLQHMLQQNLVRTILKQHGYRYIAFPSAYGPINQPSDINVKRVRGLSDFYTTLLQTTPLLEVTLSTRDTQFDPYAVHRTRVLWLLDHAATVAGLSGPQFVYIHLLAPHQPLVFDADGKAVKADPFLAVAGGRHWRNERSYREDYNRRYRDEVIYLNKRMLQMVDDIRKRSHRPTVIIIQGDHGPGFLPDLEKDLKTMSIPERFSIFNAYYFPGGTPKALYSSITPVNSFRVVFNTYLHTQYPLLPDRSYFSPFLHPYHFQDVTSQTAFSKTLTEIEKNPTAVGAD